MKLRLTNVVRLTAGAVLICALLYCLFFARAAGFQNFVLNPEWWGLCAAGAAVFLATSRSLRPRIVYGVLTIGCILLATHHRQYFRPLQHRVHQASYVDAPLRDVLHDLSADRNIKPFRQFVICDPQTFEKRVTLTIPDDCTLGEALEMVAQATASKYEWHWWSWCGNTYPPTTARIYFSEHGRIKGRVDDQWVIDANRPWLNRSLTEYR